MEIKLFNPDLLDMDQQMMNNPIPKGKGIKKDHLLFIIHCIMQQRANKDDERLRRIGKDNGFVPLHSKILESKIPNYHDCIEYLINIGIIECDGKFSPGNVSLGYRLTNTYRGNMFKQVKISDFVLCRKIAADRPFNRKNKAVKNYPYLAKWFESEKLEIDEQAALTWINEFEASELQKINSNKTLNSVNRLEEKDLLFEKSRSYKILVSRIKEKDYFFHKDETGNRLHTNLTNLPKGLRQFLTYDGQDLVSIDIKNSQPFMSLPLLEKEFWQSKDQPGKPTLKRIYKEKYEEIRENRKANNNTIMFRVSPKTLIQLDFQRQDFVKNVVNGTFYEYLIGVFEKAGLNLGATPKEKRDKVKKMVLILLFDDDHKLYNRKHGSPSQVFKRLFPSVAKIFRYVKEGNYKNLAIILQRIESYLVLERVCGKITEERPEIPIFTIHDSIITTAGNENYVQSIMEDELKRSIGNAPQFSIEQWQKEMAHP